MGRTRTAAVGLVACCLLVAGCGTTGSDSSADPEPADPSATSPAPPAASPTPTPSGATGAGSAEPSPSRSPRGRTIITADSEYGPMLYDASGQPIYLFTAEPGTRPACYGECAADWPPVLTKGSPHARGDVRGALLGTTRRSDGTSQVTYAGHPLYFYAHEGKYQVLCHDVEEYGGTWLVVRPDGTPAPA